MDISINLIFYVCAYLIGAIPFGMILARLFAGVNIKEHGSNNIGATNVMRVVKETNPSLAKKLSGLTVFLDGFKALGVLLAANYFGLEANALWAIAVLAVFGHCVSVYLWFEGGKGVATFFGALLFFQPYFTVGAVVLWIVLLKVSKISSLSSLVALGALVCTVYFFVEVEYSLKPLMVMYVIVCYKHYGNIVDLINKRESKIV